MAGGAVLWGLWLCLSRVDQFDPLLYRGGFLGAAVLAAAAIVIATHPRSWVAAGLGCRPLVWLGKRSYAVYLWFWPVFMLTRPHSDVPLTGTPLLVLRIAITLGLATASYRWVEKPIRDGALGRAWADLRSGLARRARPSVTATRWAAGIGRGPAGGVDRGAGGPPRARPALRPAGGRRRPRPRPARRLDGGHRGRASTPSTTVPAVAAPAETTVPVAVAEAAAAVAVPEPAAPAARRPPPPPGPPPGTRVTAIGESVMIVAQPAMEAEGIYVDAVIGRQFDESLAVAHALRDSGGLGEIVVVHLGNNGPVTEGQFDELMDILSVARRVVVVNLRVPRPWEEHNNNLFAAAVPRFANAVLVDWHAVGDNHPDAFVDDGVHMTHGRRGALPGPAALRDVAGLRSGHLADGDEDPLAELLDAQPPADEDHGGQALPLPEQAEEDVLGADVVVAEVDRLPQGQLEHLLAAGGEGDVPADRQPRSRARDAPAAGPAQLQPPPAARAGWPAPGRRGRTTPRCARGWSRRRCRWTAGPRRRPAPSRSTAPTGALAHDVEHVGPHVVAGHAGVGQDPGRHPVLLPDEGEQEVLGADVAVTQGAGLLLGQGRPPGGPGR